MAQKVMLNYLELAYSPVCNYVFTQIKTDERFRYLTQDSTLYVIGQRGELTIENFDLLPHKDGQVTALFEIRQKGNSSALLCKLQLYQSKLASDIKKDLNFHFEYALPKPNPLPKTFPQGGIINLLFTYRDGSFVGWLSPENFIQNYLNGAIEAEIEGPIEDFIKYKVHYVGKATEQNVWKRLTGHATLQEILSLEFPLHFGTLPTHEIAILFFKFYDSIKIHTVGVEDEITEDVINSVLGKNLPSEKTISLDAEKALINAMQPKYNKEFYKNYPKSKDGLYKFDLDGYSFRIHSHVILEYDDGSIRGFPNPIQSDAIVIEKGQPLRVFKYRE